MTQALAGRTVLVTRPAHQAAALAQAIQAAGGDAFVFPALAVEAVPAEALCVPLAHLAEADMAIFISPNAARFGMAAIRSGGTLPASASVFAVGPGTARALQVLRKLADHDHIVGVVTQPDRQAGRGRVLTSPPIKLLADELNLPVHQPRKLSEPDSMNQLHQWAPDLIVVAAFGQILRPEVLDLPKFGCINFHASLLPRWRGAAPIQAAILNGDDQTGITILCMDPGIDTGPMLSQASIHITDRETAGTLTIKLSKLGAELLVETLPRYLNSTLIPHAQDDSQATYAPMIKKEAGLLDFSQPAIDLERKVRAYNPWPGTYTMWKNQD